MLVLVSVIVFLAKPVFDFWDAPMLRESSRGLRRTNCHITWATRQPRISAMLTDKLARVQATENKRYEDCPESRGAGASPEESPTTSREAMERPRGVGCDFISSLTTATVQDVIARLGLNTGVVNAMPGSKTPAELPQLSSYEALSMMRILPDCLHVPISDAGDAARTMSETVLSMEEFMPLRAFCACLAWHPPGHLDM